MAKAKSAMEALLSANPNVEEDYFVKRLGVDFRLKAIDGDTLKQIKAQSTYVTGKGANRKENVDEDEMQRLMVAKGCIEPNFADETLLKHYGAVDESDCVKKALRIGEIALIGKRILEISGFEDDVDDVKN